jgi:predicted RNA-binding protein with PUA-like domain
VQHWIFKSEPSTFGIDDLAQAPGRTTHWDGVRNFQVRNMMRDQMQRGDLGLFYHSSCEVPGVYGTVKVAGPGYPDPSAFDPKHRYFDAESRREEPRWFCVDVKLARRFARPVTLDELRRHATGALRDLLILRRGNRLSITPLTAEQYEFIVELAGAAA